MYEQAFALSGAPVEVRNRLDALKDLAKPENPEYLAALGRADAEQSKHINTLMFCFERIVAQYHQARPHMPHAEPRDVLSVVMTRMLREGMSGCTWTRPPTREQHELALALLGNRG